MATVLQNLIQKRADLLAEGDTLRAAAEAEGRGLNEAEASRDDAIFAELTAIAPQIEREQARHAVKLAAPAIVAPDAPRVSNVRDLEAEKPWASMGEQLIAIARAQSPVGTFEGAGQVDRRLYQAAASGASAGEPSAGGFLLRSGYSDALLDRAREESPILGMCKSIPLADGEDYLDLPVIDETSRATGSRWGGVRVYRRAEADTVTASKPKFGKLVINTSELMGVAYATDRLLRNAARVEEIFNAGFASEFAFKATDEIIRGNGGDEMLGILNAPATVEQAKESGQTAATVVSANLSKMWAHVPARSKARGVWLINGDVEPQLDGLYTVAGSDSLEARFVTYDAQGAIRIKGRPVVHLEQCATLGTVGDIMFADLGEYIVSPKGGVEGQSSMHVRFLYNEMTFRWTYYINGRPAWLSSVTPYKGSTSISPFVTLATRS